MCVYCNVGDWAFKHDRPWDPDEYPKWPPYAPRPITPKSPTDSWDIQKLKEYLDLLKEIREMEEKIACPCEPNKANYIALLEERLKHLKEREALKEALKKATESEPAARQAGEK